jgi:lipopolysaccharide export system protein LptC
MNLGLPVPADAQPSRALWRRLRDSLDALVLYFPVVLMGLLAMLTYWLVRNTPAPPEEAPRAQVRHVPDYFMRDFAVRTFGANGGFQSEIQGVEIRHYPDTDTLEIDQPRIRRTGPLGQVTVAQADKGISNADGSEVQLIGHATVVREAFARKDSATQPRFELRSEFLHFFVDTDRLQTHLPVELLRGPDRFTADRLRYDNLDQQVELSGRVRGVLQPKR